MEYSFLKGSGDIAEKTQEEIAKIPEAEQAIKELPDELEQKKLSELLEEVKAAEQSKDLSKIEELQKTVAQMMNPHK